MKDQLLDRPPTIGDLRRHGVVAIEIRCARPCKHIGRLDLDRLRLPDDAAFDEIPKLRPGLRCSACDRRIASIKPIYPPQEPPPLGAHRAAAWTVVLIEDGRELTSSPLWSRTHALQFACDQIAGGARVARIDGPAETIEAAEIADWRPAGDRD